MKKFFIAVMAVAAMVACKGNMEEQNPLLVDSPLEYGAPQFDNIKF